MFFQNAKKVNKKNVLFNFHEINLTPTNPNLTYSIHLEFSPLNYNLSYLLIYKFNEQPHFHSMDNWTLFCSSGRIFIKKN
jgi:hypothetical protein